MLDGEHADQHHHDHRELDQTGGQLADVDDA